MCAAAVAHMVTRTMWFVHDAWIGSQGASICSTLDLVPPQARGHCRNVTSALCLLLLVLHMEGASLLTAVAGWTVESGWCLSRSVRCIDCTFQPVGMPDALGPCSHIGFQSALKHFQWSNVAAVAPSRRRGAYVIPLCIEHSSHGTLHFRMALCTWTIRFGGAAP